MDKKIINFFKVKLSSIEEKVGYVTKSLEKLEKEIVELKKNVLKENKEGKGKLKEVKNFTLKSNKQN